MSKAITLNNVSKAYNGRPVIRDITPAIGEIIGIVGENGSGKSTLRMDDSTLGVVFECLIVVIFPFCIPWRYVFSHYLKNRSEP